MIINPSLNILTLLIWELFNRRARIVMDYDCYFRMDTMNNNYGRTCFRVHPISIYEYIRCCKMWACSAFLIKFDAEQIFNQSVKQALGNINVCL